MPPPPPPSKSYLLVIDTDSEDEEEEDYYRQPPPLVRPPPPPPQPAVVVAPSSNPISEKDIIAESAMRIRRPESTNTTVTNNPKSNNKNRRSQHVVDEDEEEDEDDDDNSEDSKDNINITTTTVTPTTVLSPEEEQDSLEKKLTKTQKKNKKRRKKKKSKRDLKEEGSEVMVSSPANNNNQTNSTNSRATTTTTKKKLLSFSNVSIRCYERCFGSDTVPIDGGWPLGSELYKFQDSEDMTIEEFENMKQHNLKERWESIQCSGKIIDERIIKRLTERPSSSSSSSGAAVTSTATGCGDDNNDDLNNDEIPPFVFETRQWDFLSGHKNPLFRPLLEEERQELFLRYSTPTAEDNNTNNNKDSSADHMSYTTINSKRSRSSSISSMSDISVGSNGGQTSSCGGSSNTRRKSRSNSVSSSPCQFNETYNQVYVHHVRNELEQLRNDRTKSGATGCNCRKLTVYLPPKDGSGGKKAQHRRMKPSKVVNELKKRNMYNPNKKSSREELERTLHDAVEKEPCCIGNDCFCIRNGIECQADACSCWHDSHVHTKSGGGVGGDKKKKDSTLSVQEIKNRCGNPLGTMVVDIAGIDNFRSMILSSGGICQPVDMSI